MQQCCWDDVDSIKNDATIQCKHRYRSRNTTRAIWSIINKVTRFPRIVDSNEEENSQSGCNNASKQVADSDYLVTIAMLKYELNGAIFWEMLSFSMRFSESIPIESHVANSMNFNTFLKLVDSNSHPFNFLGKAFTAASSDAAGHTDTANIKDP